MKLRAWTGPCAVRQIAARLRQAGVKEVSEGVEYVYFVADAADAYDASREVRAAMMTAHGFDCGIKPEVVR